MKIDNNNLLELIRIRVIEQSFLDLFSKGLMNGTVHTCIGQELSAIAFAGQVLKTDFIFSNHRCHGHYISYTKDWKGLILELMGKMKGVCAGIGSSQHLQKDNFYSNGIQGGIVPLAAGYAFGNKLMKNNNIGIVFIGDGTLGEGIVYETLNFISNFSIPLLVVCENNQYAQSTSTKEKMAGTIEARAKAFGIKFVESNTYDGSTEIIKEAKDSIDYVRKYNKPVFHLVNTYRLKAHSKGDDDRDKGEIDQYSERDFLNIFKKSRPDEFNKIYGKIQGEVDNFIKNSLSEIELPIEKYFSSQEKKEVNLTKSRFENFSKERLVKRINTYLSSKLKESQKTILLGEDIVDPYGGAFKVTKGLSTAFPQQVFSTTISEGLIAGVTNGLALNKHQPIAEIMFGDFTALAFDQLLNHAAKFRNMYNKKVSCPAIFRTPMGGGRGYGPTHSQSIEKHFIGMETFTILALNRIIEPHFIYDFAFENSNPTLIIENKIDYGKTGILTLPEGYQTFFIETETTPIISIENEQSDFTILTYGGMVDHALESIEEIIIKNDLIPRILILSQLDPIPPEIFNLLENSNKIAFLEEGIDGGTIGDYYISHCAQRFKSKEYYSFKSKRTSIPSAKSLEKEMLDKIIIT